jgi:hypothetical protein
MDMPPPSACENLRPVFATESDQKLTIELEDAATPELPIAPD